MAKDYKNILIIKPSALGDIAIALPALSSLRSRFPSAKISWLVRNEFSPLLEDVDGLDEIILFDRKKLGAWWWNPSVCKELWSFIMDLRARKYDLVVDLQGLFRTAFLSFITGCRKRYGMSIAREGATFLYTDSVKPPEESIHVIDYSLKILSSVCAGKTQVSYNLSASPEADAKVKSMLNESRVGKRDFVVFVTGSARDNKCWPKKYFAQLADKISENYNLPIVTVGSESERKANEDIISQSKGCISDFSGRTGIRELTALLNRARLVVSNDTGPGHIAVALGREVVMVFGPTNPGRICPYGLEGSVVAVDSDIRGKEINDYRPEYAIDKVSVDMVYDAVSNKLNRSE